MVLTNSVALIKKAFKSVYLYFFRKNKSVQSVDLIIFESFLTILDRQAKSAAKVQKRFDIRKSRRDKIHFWAFHIVYLSAK